MRGKLIKKLVKGITVLGLCLATSVSTFAGTKVDTTKNTTKIDNTKPIVATEIELNSETNMDYIKVTYNCWHSILTDMYAGVSSEEPTIEDKLNDAYTCKELIDSVTTYVEICGKVNNILEAGYTLHDVKSPELTELMTNIRTKAIPALKKSEIRTLDGLLTTNSIYVTYSLMDKVIQEINKENLEGYFKYSKKMIEQATYSTECVKDMGIKLLAEQEKLS